MDWAAAAGDLAKVQQLHASGVPWTEWACGLAVLNDHLDVLRWLRANGCPWDRDRCLSTSIYMQNIDISAWIESDSIRTKSAAPRHAAPRERATNFYLSQSQEQSSHIANPHSIHVSGPSPSQNMDEHPSQRS